MTDEHADRIAFIRAHATVESPPLTPELKLWLAKEATELWEATEEFLAEKGLPPPFWAFAWAGGQALARFALDRPQIVKGKRVLDFGAGCGMVAIAALIAGAKDALAADLDEFAAASAILNGTENGVTPRAFAGDATTLAPADFDVILAADVCYDRRQADPATAWLRQAANAGTEVYIGDPGRRYFPDEGLEPLADYDIPTPVALEQYPITPTRVWRLTAS
ncbi:MAG: methyltransferase [Alphaproteobacteria bacterium]|nr:methyltransferase [Alphaproteobacteria bacterium]